MRPKLSIMVLRRYKAVKKLAEAIRRPMSGVLEALEKYFGETLPGGQRVFELMADGLLRELDWLVAMDRKKYDEENAVEDLRQEVQQTTAALYSQTVSTRDSIVGAFGRTQARKLIKGRLSRSPDALFDQAAPIVSFLKWQTSADCPEESKPEGFEPEFHFKRLSTLSERLRTAQIGFQRQEDSLSIAREKWADAITQLDDSCRSSIKIAEGLHELAGVDAKLGSFRKAIRKRAYEKRQSEDDEAGDLEAEAAPDDGESV